MLVRNYANYEKVKKQCITIDEKESQQILVDVNRTRKHLPNGNYCDKITAGSFDTWFILILFVGLNFPFIRHQRL